MINQQIMLYSVPRTGSTLIWQCLTKIFTRVPKAHRDQMWQPAGGDTWISTRKKGVVLNYSCPCVITERGMMDTFLSQWRNHNPQTEAFMHEWLCAAYGDNDGLGEPLDVKYPLKQYSGWTRKNDGLQGHLFDAEKFKKACDNRTEICYVRHNFDPLRRIACVFRKHLEHLEKVKAEYKGPMLILQYEQFWNNYDYIFSEFEKFFDIIISEETKTEIKNTTSRDSNRVAQEKLRGFRQMNSTQIHGGHIFLAEPGYSNKVLGEKNLRRIQTLLTCDPDDILEIELEE
jgi:hypothetical protein